MIPIIEEAALRKAITPRVVLATAELGEIVAGVKPGRTAAHQLTIADLTGVGFQDTAIASAYLEMWKWLGSS